jgi:hypothetical protein
MIDLSNTSKTPLSKALAHGDGQTAQALMGQTAEYTLQERWQITVFKNADFNDEEFLSLTPELQRLIYRTANNFNNILLVARLNTLGTYNFVDISIKKPCILSMRMDCATTYQNVSDYLVKLRQENRLLTETEFKDLHAHQSWRKKDHKITRIFGRDCILQLIEKLHLKHIKVPEKKVVISSNQETLSFEIAQCGDQGLVDLRCDEIDIYAQTVQRTDRFVSREEITELLIIIEAANFSDLWDRNFIVAEDGIYFIDTEIKSFIALIQWGNMGRLTCFMAEDDQEWFAQQIEQKFEDQANAEAAYFKEEERFTSLFSARSWLRVSKKLAEKNRLKGIETELDPTDLEYKQIVKQHKLVGTAFPAPHYTKTYSFSVQEILKK